MSDQTPTVVLVHGAFADASSWNGVVELLLAQGVKDFALFGMDPEGRINWWGEGARRLIRRAKPRSWTITASTPA